MINNPRCAVFTCATHYLDTQPSLELQALVSKCSPDERRFSENMACLKNMTTERGRIIADHYEELQHTPEQPETQASYRQLAIEICQQYEYLMASFGLEIEPWLGEDEPYSGSQEMFEDVGNHRHLYFYPTTTAFGESTDFAANPLLEDTGEKIKGHKLCVNDMFRVIHDIFGHFLNQVSFGPIGEERAWFAHWQFFSWLARPALTTETRGQNCWFNCGPHLRTSSGQIPRRGDPEWVHPASRPFADQKVGLLSSEITGIQLLPIENQVIAQPLTPWTPHLEDFYSSRVSSTKQVENQRN